MTNLLEPQSPILTIRPKIALSGFIRECKTIRGIDAKLVYHVALKTIAYLRGNKKKREYLRIAQTLEQHWYKSLFDGSPDWQVYNTDYYLGELWACWIVYSRSYLRSLLSPRSLPSSGVLADLGRVQKIVDLGCGLGYTTAVLREIFPSANVVGTELDGTLQAKLAQQLGQRYRFQVMFDIKNIKAPVDVVFASEYFEHIPAPVQHLRDIIHILRPRVILVANAFNTRAIGHFEYYNVNGRELDGKRTSMQFNLELRQQGFTKMKTNLWNNRPAYWKRLENQ